MKGEQPRRWHLKPILIVALVVVVVLGGGFAAAAFVVGTTFSTLHTVGTAPATVRGDVVGGDRDGQVETGPAQTAVASERVAQGGSAPGGDAGGLWGTAKDVWHGAGEITSGAAAVAGISKPSTPSTGMNLLLMGVEAPPGKAIDSGLRADGLLVLHLDPATGSCRILTIPGNARAELPGYGPTMIRNALAVGGIPYQRQVIAEFLGLPIEHYGLIDLAGLPDLVQAVGGVTIDNDVAFSVDGRRFPRGEQRLDGAQALAFSRYGGGPDGEAGRLRRRQMVIRALVARAASPQVVTALPTLLPVFQQHTRTDLSAAEMIALVREAGPACSGATAEVASLRGTGERFPDPLARAELTCLVVAPAEVRDKVPWLQGD